VLPELRTIWEKCETVADNWSAKDFARWSESYYKIPVFLQRMHQAGVLLTTGSDVPNPWVIPGESLHQELELLVEAGFTPSQVIRMATLDAAKALGLESTIGSIAAGKQADLVLLTQNPLDDISNTRSIAWVMEDGDLITRDK